MLRAASDVQTRTRGPETSMFLRYHSHILPRNSATGNVPRGLAANNLGGEPLRRCVVCPGLAGGSRCEGPWSSYSTRRSKPAWTSLTRSRCGAPPVPRKV